MDWMKPERRALLQGAINHHNFGLWTKICYSLFLRVQTWFLSTFLFGIRATRMGIFSVSWDLRTLLYKMARKLQTEKLIKNGFLHCRNAGANNLKGDWYSWECTYVLRLISCRGCGNHNRASNIFVWNEDYTSQNVTRPYHKLFRVQCISTLTAWIKQCMYNRPVWSLTLQLSQDKLLFEQKGTSHLRILSSKCNLVPSVLE